MQYTLLKMKICVTQNKYRNKLNADPVQINIFNIHKIIFIVFIKYYSIV